MMMMSSSITTYNFHTSCNTISTSQTYGSSLHDNMPSKQCTICHTPRPVLVRCQIDESAQWHFVCPGKCWKSVSGGVEDAKGLEGEFPWYRYGGMVCLSLSFLFLLKFVVVKARDSGFGFGMKR